MKDYARYLDCIAAYVSVHETAEKGGHTEERAYALRLKALEAAFQDDIASVAEASKAACEAYEEIATRLSSSPFALAGAAIPRKVREVETPRQFNEVLHEHQANIVELRHAMDAYCDALNQQRSSGQEVAVALEARKRALAERNRAVHETVPAPTPPGSQSERGRPSTFWLLLALGAVALAVIIGCIVAAL